MDCPSGNLYCLTWPARVAICTASHGLPVWQSVLPAPQFGFIDSATLFGIVCGYLSTFLAWSYTRAGRKLGMLQVPGCSAGEGAHTSHVCMLLRAAGSQLVSLAVLEMWRGGRKPGRGRMVFGGPAGSASWLHTTPICLLPPRAPCSTCSCRA